MRNGRESLEAHKIYHFCRFISGGLIECLTVIYKTQIIDIRSKIPYSFLFKDCAFWSEIV
jgi:hypothetical protein